MEVGKQGLVENGITFRVKNEKHFFIQLCLMKLWIKQRQQQRIIQLCTEI